VVPHYLRSGDPARRGKTEVLVMALGTRYFARRIRAAYSVGVGLSWSFVPEAGEGVGHGLLLRRRQLTAELALDDAHVLDECLVVSPPPFRRQDDAGLRAGRRGPALGAPGQRLRSDPRAGSGRSA